MKDKNSRWLSSCSLFQDMVLDSYPINVQISLYPCMNPFSLEDPRRTVWSCPLSVHTLKVDLKSGLVSFLFLVHCTASVPDICSWNPVPCVPLLGLQLKSVTLLLKAQKFSVTLMFLFYGYELCYWDVDFLLSSWDWWRFQGTVQVWSEYKLAGIPLLYLTISLYQAFYYSL